MTSPKGPYCEAEIDTLLGYPIKALVLVADALQQQMVRPEDLAEWIRHVDTAYRYVNESFEADLRRTIHSLFGGTEYNATPESADGGEEGRGMKEHIEYIEKEAALREMCDACNRGSIICDYKCGRYRCIEKAHPADVKPVVRGEWICVDDDKNIWQCTHCADEVIIEAGTPFENEWYYCSHCGADMRKEKRQ